MSSGPLTTFNIPSYQQLLTSLLNDYRNVSNNFGYNLSIDPGSEIYIRYSGLAGQLAVLYNASNVLVNSKLIDTATGADLDRVANAFGLYRRGATASSGAVSLISAVSQTLIAGQLLTGPQALQYQVSTTGTYSPNADVPVSSVDLGSNTNLPVGSLLTWSSPPVGLQSTTQVTVVITGGADSEDDNTLRNRLYLQLQSPGQPYNDQNLITLCGSVDSIIQQAFIYSNFNGAGTQLIALTGYQTTSYIGRDIPHLLTDGYVKPYGLTSLQPGLLVQSDGYGAYNQWSLGVDNLAGAFDGSAPGNAGIGNPGPNLISDTSTIYGQLPGPIANPYATVITTVNNYPSDIAAVLQLPFPVGSAINGFGNGWMDSIPWPNPDGVYVPDGYCKIISVQGTGTVVGGQTGFGITVSAASSGAVHTNPPHTSSLTYSNNVPTPGSTHIQWVNRSDFQDNGWSVVTATVLGALDNGNDTWSLTLDTPLVYPPDGYDFYNITGAHFGQFIFPASNNAQNYLNTVMQQYALLGPGQATDSQGLLTLGASRYPSANAQFPSTLGLQLERALVTNFQEVYAATVAPTVGSFGAKSAYNAAFLPPPVNSPPNIYIPRRIAFYSAEFYNYGTR